MHDNISGVFLIFFFFFGEGGGGEGCVFFGAKYTCSVQFRKERRWPKFCKFLSNNIQSLC